MRFCGTASNRGKRMLAFIVAICVFCAAMPLCAIAESVVPEGRMRCDEPKVTAYLTIRMYEDEMPPYTKLTYEGSGGLRVSVLEFTQWQLRAVLIVTAELEDGSTTTTEQNVTSECVWSSSNSNYVSVSNADKGKGFVTVYDACVGGQSVYAIYKDDFVASVHFDIYRLSINPLDEETAALYALSYLANNEYLNMVNYKGNLVRSFIHNASEKLQQDPESKETVSETTTSYLKAGGLARKNSARVLHFLSAAAGSYAIEGCFADASVRAVVFNDGKKRYMAFAGGHGEANQDLAAAFEAVENDGTRRFAAFSYGEIGPLFEQGLSLYRSAGSSGAVTPIGLYFGGTIAKYVAYMDDCSSISFDAPSPLQYLMVKNFETLCTNYNIAEQVSYISPSEYDRWGMYTVEPGNVVYRYYENVIPFFNYNNVDETVSIDRKPIEIDKNRKLWNRSAYLGDKSSESYYNVIPKTSETIVFGGPGDDEIILRYNWQDLSDVIGIIRGSKDIADLITKWSKAGFVLSVVQNLLEFSLFHSPVSGNLFIGGKGNDTITSFYSKNNFCYTYGDGVDTYWTSGANDRIYLMGCEGHDVSVRSGTDLVTAYIDGELKITIHCLRDDVQEMAFYLGNPFENGKPFEVVYPERYYYDQATETMKGMEIVRQAGIFCPVDVLVYDDSGALVQELLDGQEYQASTEYGFFRVVKRDGEYGKLVTLYDDAYTMVIRAVDDGTMDFSETFRRASEDGEAYCAMDTIPCRKGALYYVSKDMQECILKVDEDADGSIDYDIRNDTAVQLSETSATLRYGEDLQLTASAENQYGHPECRFYSSDDGVAAVDDDGVVSAIGFGEAVIYAYATDGSEAFATCAVSVPEEALSAENFTVTGLEAEYAYTGEPIEAEIEVAYGKLRLTAGRDYALAFSEMTAPGKATLTVSGVGRYSGTAVLAYEIVGEVKAETVAEKVDSIVAEMDGQGVQGTWERALWLHDWLIYHANYDTTYTNYDPDGVLLKGTGVCESYSLAYQLLLDKAGIENRFIAAPTEMNHAWNLVKIDGEWCHVDCTWDDPGTGGAENHLYFGMNDALISRDHRWNASGLPASASLDSYYPLRMGMLCFSNEEELAEIMEKQAAAKASPITLMYIGTDPEQDALSAVEKWIGENNWKYGMLSHDASYSDYSCTLDIEYTDPWEKPQNHLDTPVDAPDFMLDGPLGRYRLGNYGENGVVLVFGRTICPNTRNLLKYLSSRLPDIYAVGVDILVSMQDVTEAEDFEEFEAEFPGFHYAFADKARAAKDYLDAVGCPSEARGVFPYVFVVNRWGKITYYTTAYVSQPGVLMKEISAVATKNPLPEPEEIVDPDPGIEVDAPDFTLNSPRGSYSLRNYGDNGLILVYGRNSCSNTRGLLDKLSGHLEELYAGGVDVLVSIEGAAEASDLEALEADYPGYHYTYDGGFINSYLRAVGESSGNEFPFAFVINREGRIIYYHVGAFGSVNSLMNSAGAVATGNPIPEPEVHVDLDSLLNGSGNVNDIQTGESMTPALQSASANSNVIFCMAYSSDGLLELMQYYENHRELFGKLNVSMVVSAAQGVQDAVKAAYPHCQFVDFSNSDFWRLLRTAGFSEERAQYATGMLIDRGGDIAAYKNGDMPDAYSCVVYFARYMRYDATVPKALTAIEEGAFYGTAFRSIDLSGGSLREICSGAFDGCDGLEIVRVPESVSIIGENAIGENTTLVCTFNSAAYAYARANGLEFICE